MSTFGDNLRSIRDQAVKAGVPLLTEDEVLEERKRRLVGEEEPLPCPFCGEKPTVERIVSPGWMITCCSPKCLMADVTCYGSTSVETVAVWNRRA